MRKQPCNCREKAKLSYVLVQTMSFLPKETIPSCLDMRVRPEGVVYTFPDRGTGENFARFVQSSYGLTCRIA
jgi:hypothetical protein